MTDAITLYGSARRIMFTALAEENKIVATELFAAAKEKFETFLVNASRKGGTYAELVSLRGFFCGLGRLKNDDCFNMTGEEGEENDTHV